MNRKTSFGSEFLQAFIGHLTSSGVVDPEGLVEDGDTYFRQIYVATDKLTSSEAEAVVSAMLQTLIAPIKLRGEVFYRDGDICHVNASFYSAKGGRRVTLQSWDGLIGEAIDFNRNFVLERPATENGDSEWDFGAIAGSYVRIPCLKAKGGV